VRRITDRLYVGKGDKELYDRLADEWILRNKTRKEQFLLAMAFGFKSGVRRELDQRDEFFFRKDLRVEDEALLDAVAIQAEGTLDVLSDEERVLSIAQEYAHAGIRLLADEIEGASFGSFEKKFERELFEAFKALTGGSHSKPDEATR